MFGALTGEGTQPKTRPANKLLGVLAAIGGFVFARYTSPFIYVPLGATLAIGYACKRWLPANRQRAALAIAVQAGYIVWLIVGVAVARAPSGLIDIIVLGAALTWFTTSMSRASAIAVAALHSALLAFNAWQYATAPAASMEQRALVVHAVFRVLAAGLALRTLWPSRSSAATETGV